MSEADQPKFYRLSLPERRARIAAEAGLDDAALDALQGSAGLSPEQADHMVENALGVFGLPLGVAQHFIVNGRAVLVPMAIEEPSVIAGASFMARLAQPQGFFTSSSAPEMIGQIQVLDVPFLAEARARLLENKDELLAQAAAVDSTLVALGGGPRGLEVRLFDQSPVGPFLVVHLIYDVRDAMGANAINTALEKLAPRVAELTGGRTHLRILSNLADHRLARARVTIPLNNLGFGAYSAEAVRDGIIAAWAFAAVDPYRAATHNKGIMNGIDAVVIATGNDWRAVEAGAHAYAARSGRYTSLSTWSKGEDGSLLGSLEMPMAVGIVGGATRVHKGAAAAIQLMGVKTAAELAEVIVSVGLAQNLGALRALATEGIQRGHMALHARQVAIAAGAPEDMVAAVSEQMINEGKIHIQRALEIIESWRAK